MESNDWTDAERRVERAAELFEQRKLDEALEELRAAVNVNPYNPGWLYNLGLTLEEMGRPDEAVEAFTQALELEPEDVSALHRLGVNLHRLGRFRDAIAAFDRIEAIQNDFEPAYCGRVASYTELGEHDNAEAAFYLGRQVVEHCPTCYFNIAVSLIDRKLWARAIYCLRRTLELQPQHQRVHVRLAQAYQATGQLDRARRHLISRLRQAPMDATVVLELTELLLRMDRKQEAGQRISSAASLLPGSPHVQFARGLWCLSQNQLAEAAAAFLRTLELDPTFPRAHLRLAQVRFASRQLIQAKTHLRSEMLLRSEDPVTLRELSNLLIDTGELRSAITCLRRLLAAAPGDLTALQNLGVAHFLRHQYTEGINACRKALEVNPTHAPVIHNLAMALGELGRFEEAIALIRTSPSASDLGDLMLRLRIRQAQARVKSFVARVLRLRRGRPAE